MNDQTLLGPRPSLNLACQDCLQLLRTSEQLLSRPQDLTREQVHEVTQLLCRSLLRVSWLGAIHFRPPQLVPETPQHQALWSLLLHCQDYLRVSIHGQDLSPSQLRSQESHHPSTQS